MFHFFYFSTAVWANTMLLLMCLLDGITVWSKNNNYKLNDLNGKIEINHKSWPRSLSIARQEITNMIWYET